MEYSKLEKFYKDDAYCGFTKEFDVERYREYADFVKKHSNGKIYEIGSGLGQAAMALKLSNIQVIATDIFPQNAKNFFNEIKVEIPIEELNINNINKEDNSVDNYCLYQVMEHIENPEKALKEIYRTLKPSGKFILVGPNLLSPLTSLKCLFMGITGKWNTPWFSRKDNYSFPIGGTIVEVFFIFFRNLFLSTLKLIFRNQRKIIYHTPCLQKPAISDSDAVILLNPYDMKELFEQIGFEVIDFQSRRKFGGFSGSTWIVGKK